MDFKRTVRYNISSMKLQVRFMLLVLFVLLSGTITIVVQHKVNIDRSQSVLISELSQRKQYFDSITTLESAPLQTLSEDYSFWDEMVSFVKTKNPSFAERSIDTSLQTFNVDGAWVYGPDGKLIYKSGVAKSLNDLNLPASFFTLMDIKKTSHFYMSLSGKIFEIRAATIVPSSDPAHDSQPQSFWMIAKRVDQSYINTLSNLTHSTLTLQPPTAPANDVLDGNSVSFVNKLESWDGTPIGAIRSTSTVDVINELNHSYKQQIIILICVTLGAGVLLALCMYVLVLQPLTYIENAVRRQDPSILNRLRGKKTEFENLSNTIREFFKQKIVIAENEFKKRELEKINKEKSDYLAVAAHELNNPVNSVKIFAEFATFLMSQHAPEKELAKQLNRISHQAIKMHMLIDDIHDASVGKSSMQFNYKTFDFDTFLTEEVEEARFSIKHDLKLTGSTNLSITSDPDRLSQVVTNLIRNAYKYSPDAKEIIIESKKDDEGITVSVKDFGVGISEEDQKHVFDRFFRASSVAGSFPGLGLGLAISKQIVEKLGGKIWVESTLGKGSVFSFHLPIQAPPIDSDKKPSWATTPRNRFF